MPRRSGKARVAPHVVKVRLYPLVADAVDGGVKYGIRRVFKYDGTQRDEDAMLAAADTIVEAVLNELCDLIEFDPDDGQA